MTKKCIICSAIAVYGVKGTSDFYCMECAEENFDDLSLLEKIEDQHKPEPIPTEFSDLIDAPTKEEE